MFSQLLCGIIWIDYFSHIHFTFLIYNFGLTLCIIYLDRISKN